MSNFNKPVASDNYLAVLAELRQKAIDQGKMFADGSHQNIPVGCVRMDASNKFQKWNGSAWVDAPISTAGGGTGNGTGKAPSAGSADSVAWAGVSGKPDTATRWPAFSEVTGKPAVIAAGATQQEAREAVGISNAMIADQASISSSGSTGVVTTADNRQVNASFASAASGELSQVNASFDCIASGYNSQINASSLSTASGENSQVNTSYDCTASGYNSQVNASSLSTASGNQSQVNASYGCTASGARSQVNASSTCTAAEPCSQVNASILVVNSTSNSIAMGFAPSGGASTANQKIRLESYTGIGRFKGNTTTTGFDYAEFFPNLTQEIIPVGTIVTLDGDKVKPASEDDFILGVVSETYGVLGNSADFCWHGRELRNEFGGVIKHDVEMVRWTNELSTYDGRVADAVDIPADATYYTVNVAMENPDYIDQGSDYVDRSERKDEWSIIGLMGQVYVRVYAEIPNNTFVSAGGTPSNTETNLYCMAMTTPYDTEKGYGVAKCLIR